MISKVSIPEALAVRAYGNPEDLEIIESVCYTKLAEPYLVEKLERDTDFWANYNVTPSWTYFGAHNGMFRQIPASHREECGSYDPRRRPWFVAASSGPKDVVLILDVSGSMSDYGRLSIMKDAAITGEFDFALNTQSLLGGKEPDRSHVQTHYIFTLGTTKS
mmetsp:Transcript_25508/g.51932  ORF Transcript_25508/g.51932 Transcript_25508/m.51932 type:complete len:162 (+) Transcript_25508:465-950(+)